MPTQTPALTSLLLAVTLILMTGAGPAQTSSRGAGLQYEPLLSADAPWPDDGRDTLLTFVHLSDPHVGRRSDAESFAIAIEAIERLNPQPAFVVITGDLTESFRDAEVLYLKHLVDRFTLPVLLVPGNHDVGFDPTPDSIAKWNAAFPEFETPYQRDFGPVRIVAMDAQLYNARRANTEVNQEAKRQWRAMTTMVREAKRERRRTIMAYHIPIVPNFFRQRVSGSWRTADMKRMRSLLSTHKVEATLTGHLHRDETYLEDETWMLNAPPISLKYEREPSYRLFRVTGSGLMFRQVYLTEEGSSLSYQMDLHDMTPERIDQSVDEMSLAELQTIWGYRYAGDVGTERLFRALNVSEYTRFLRKPFSQQPKDSRTRFFREDARPH